MLLFGREPFREANLFENLNTLVMHEIAHHYGANERLAKAVETFFASVRSRNYSVFIPFHVVYLDLGRSLKTIGNQLRAVPETSQSDLCFTISRLQSLALSLDLFSSRMPDEVFSITQSASFLSKQITDVVGFCFLTQKGRNQRDNGFPYPKVGDREALIANLVTTNARYEELGQSIKKDIGYETYDPSQDPWTDPIEDRRP